MLFLIGEELCMSLFLLSLSSVFPPAVGSAFNPAAGPASFPFPALRQAVIATEGPWFPAAVLMAQLTLRYQVKTFIENQGKT